MSTNVIAFDQTNTLPAHLMGASSGGGFGDVIASLASVKYPVIVAKQGRFYMKRDGESTLILRPKTNKNDPDEPTTYIDVVILNAQKGNTYYAEGYTDGSDAKPDCQSADGITPDADAAKKQCDSCALCPQNAWGSGKNDKGEATKGKACNNNLKLAIAAADNMREPMLFKVAPASLTSVGELAKALAKRGAEPNCVVTRINFNPDVANVLSFAAVGWLNEAQYAEAKSMLNSDIVLSITGKKFRGLESVPAHLTKPAAQPASAKPAAPAAPDPAEAAAKAKAEAKAKKVAAAKAAMEAAAKAAAEAEGDDDEEVATAPATAVATSDNFDDELSKLIG